MPERIDPQALRRRIQYRASHRGTKEMDILLGHFAAAALDGMTEGEMALFEQMLALPDPDIDSWIRGGAPPEIYADLIERIRKFHRF
ncbi:MAG: succinate dehydrogenase assembly factor 2 [Dichotomicrobium sp.]